MTVVEQARPATDLLAADRDHLVHPLQYPGDHQTPIVFTRGEGVMLYDTDGKSYIDGLASLWNVNCGHGRRELAEVAAEQMSQLAFTTNYVGAANVPAIRLAEKLVELCYPSMRAVYFTTGGAESNESAFKTARFYWKVQGKPAKIKIISRVHGYHGVTMAAASATGIPAFHKMFAPLVPNFIQVVPPHAYRWPDYAATLGTDPAAEAGAAAIAALEATILREGPETVAAVIAEPVMGAGGLIVPPDTYFPLLRALCDRYDILFIADEIITGFGRTGDWFALNRWDVEPDIVSFAKGVTSAYLPLGGIIINERVYRAIQEAPADLKYMHAATYSGHPTCCAVGLRNVEIIERERLPERAAVAGARLLAGLQELRQYHVVGDVRGLGLMCGVELVEDHRSTEAPRAPLIGLGGKVLAAARQRGLLGRLRAGVRGDYPLGDVICLAPPLVISDTEVDRMVSILHESIRAVI